MLKEHQINHSKKQLGCLLIFQSFVLQTWPGCWFLYCCNCESAIVSKIKAQKNKIIPIMSAKLKVIEPLDAMKYHEVDTMKIKTKWIIYMKV